MKKRRSINPKYENPLMLLASKQPIGDALANQEINLWWLCFDNVMTGHCRETAVPAYTRILLRLAFMAGYSRHERLNTQARAAVAAWLTAAERCDAKGMRHITLTAAEADTLRATFKLMAIALPQLPFDAYAQAKARIDIIDMEEAA